MIRPPQVGDIIIRSTVPGAIEWKVVAINTIWGMISTIDLENRDNGGYIHKTENHSDVMKEYDFVLQPTKAPISYYPNNSFLGSLPTGYRNTINGYESCTHDWKQYVGFKECYDFCLICDQKRDYSGQ